MSSESKVSELERRVNELEETTRRQFNLTVMGIAIAVMLTLLLNYLISPAEYSIATSLKILGDRVHNLAVHTKIPREQLDAPPALRKAGDAPKSEPTAEATAVAPVEPAPAN